MRAAAEGVALWLGRKFGPAASITHVVSLRGPGVVKRPDLSISAGSAQRADRHRDGSWRLSRGANPFPPRAWVDLSEADKRFGIQADGYLSVVTPYFASKPDADLGEYGFHAFEGAAGADGVGRTVLAREDHLERDRRDRRRRRR